MGTGKEGMFQGGRNDLHHMLLIRGLKCPSHLAALGGSHWQILQAVLLEQ